MRSPNLGTGTLGVEVLNVTLKGIWLYVAGQEYFLSYEDFAWFKNASIAQIHNVKLSNNHHLHWPSLDVDLELESLSDPGRYPLAYH